MNKLLKASFLCIIFCLFIPAIQAQDNLSRDSISTYNFYTKFGSGLTLPTYRDFATSPLFYSGIGLHLSSAWLKKSEERERIFKIGMNISALTARISQSDLIQPSTLGFMGNFNLFYQQLWKIEYLSNQKNNTKVGGALQLTQNVRGNPALQNNAMGLENLSNLSAAAQWTRDISRVQEKQLNLWIWKPTLKPIKRDLRVLLNVGILNFNYRPGYAYSYDGELKGTETNPVEWAFENYKWSLNGWRLQTQIEYIKYLPNGNARSLSYVWQAAHAPGKFEDFQMASHRLQYTIYFHTKKR
ncbi:hypothetical protein CW751_05650 [Brumimicrobium salinarum]|uniref:DUF2490 domain-containing protein n=1 Tax=Brumimicrobium salinarum TaxID=2058658 RepID=A0A2I0R3B2_9FLAO|nr:hypothetical protein [Brumimicrobium salinarum]PKR81068.1 hypothetical protein CW751_05650 [Brumimicrobium salinarum]